MNRSIQLIFIFFKTASKQHRFRVLSLQPPKSKPFLLPLQQLPLHPPPTVTRQQPFLSSPLLVFPFSRRGVGNPSLLLEAWKPPRLAGTPLPPGCKHPTPPVAYRPPSPPGVSKKREGKGKKWKKKKKLSLFMQCSFFFK